MVMIALSSLVPADMSENFLPRERCPLLTTQGSPDESPPTLSKITAVLQMSTVSSGLADDTNLQMLALCCDTRSLKTWAKDSLAVRSFPSIMALPRNEPNVYRLTERGRTESGVVVFLNTVFQREGDSVLALSPSAAVSAAAPVPSASPAGEPHGALYLV